MNTSLCGWPSLRIHVLLGGLPQRMPPAMGQCGKLMSHVSYIVTVVCEISPALPRAPAVNRCGKPRAMTSCDISCDIGYDVARRAWITPLFRLNCGVNDGRRAGLRLYDNLWDRMAKPMSQSPRRYCFTNDLYTTDGKRLSYSCRITRVSS